MNFLKCKKFQDIFQHYVEPLHDSVIIIIIIIVMVFWLISAP